jgi:hypothetical protein
MIGFPTLLALLTLANLHIIRPLLLLPRRQRKQAASANHRSLLVVEKIPKRQLQVVDHELGCLNLKGRASGVRSRGPWNTTSGGGLVRHNTMCY